MAFDSKQADASLVEILDALNGDRVVGMGVRLPGDVIATSCRCLPRHAGRVHLPDPSAPSLPVLARVRKPGTGKAAFAVVAAANPYSRLALLRGAKAAGLEVPDELNPVISMEALLDELEPARPEPSPLEGGPVHVYGEAGQWIEATVQASTITVQPAAGRLRGISTGAPAFDEAGRVLGIVGTCDEAGLEAQLCRLADHLPGWALRLARELEPATAEQVP